MFKLIPTLYLSLIIFNVQADENWCHDYHLCISARALLDRAQDKLSQMIKENASTNDIVEMREEIHNRTLALDSMRKVYNNHWPDIIGIDEERLNSSESGSNYTYSYYSYYTPRT